MLQQCFYIFGVMAVVTFPGSSLARGDFLEAWKVRYPESISSRRNCQLCHARSGGGDGWNNYGFDVRNEFIQISRADINLAFENSEQFNSDNDSDNLSNLVEIQQGLDPGWRKGVVNFVFYKDDTFDESVLPPFADVDTIDDVEDEFCLPVVKRGPPRDKKRIAIICL